jgi:hypothetical protein
VGVTVRRPTSQLDAWNAIPGETRWLDYSCQEVGENLMVYVHVFRRVRERLDSRSDLLLWKPATTRVAQRYGGDEWAEVVRAEREWPPVEVRPVSRRRGSPRRDSG